MTAFDRRTFIRTALASVGTLACGRPSCAATSKSTVAAAIQYAPVLGNVDKNLQLAEQLILEATKLDAKWIVLPEFFTSGLAMHPSMFDAPRPIDGAPTQLLKQIAIQHGIYIGGSFLCRDGKDVFNTFVLVMPTGDYVSHDKDFPSTGYESSFYAGGEDAEYAKTLRAADQSTLTTVVEPRVENNTDGIFRTPDARVGAALCWELVRYRTSRRLLGNIDFLMGASGWWWSSADLGWPGREPEAIRKDRAQQLKLIQAVPRIQARMLGVPVVHANFVGENPGFYSRDFKIHTTGRYLGQSQIVDCTGKEIKRLGEKEEGVAVAEIELPTAKPLDDIPADKFWMEEVNARGRDLWCKTGAEGRDFYLTETRAKTDVTMP